MNKKSYYENYDNKVKKTFKGYFYIILFFALIIAITIMIKVFFPDFYLEYIDQLIYKGNF